MMTNECGTNRIAGCQFTLFPMSEDFVDVILSALEQVDTSKVWKETDDVSTCIRGKMVHVFDVANAIFLHAVKSGKHVAMSGTFSIGCPGDSEGHVYMDETNEPMNQQNVQEIQQKQAANLPSTQWEQKIIWRKSPNKSTCPKSGVLRSRRLTMPPD